LHKSGEIAEGDDWRMKVKMLWRRRENFLWAPTCVQSKQLVSAQLLLQTYWRRFVRDSGVACGC